MQKILILFFLPTIAIHTMEQKNFAPQKQLPKKNWQQQCINDLKSLAKGIQHDLNEFNEEFNKSTKKIDHFLNTVSDFFITNMKDLETNINHLQISQKQAKFNIIEHYIAYGKQYGCNKEQVTKFIEFYKKNYSSINTDDQTALDNYLISLDSPQQQ